MCRLFRGGKAETCYLEPFSTDGMPPATEQAHALFRKAGMSGFSDKGLQIMIATLLAEINEPAGAFTIQDVLQLFGFDGNRTAENACNNHRAVPVATALPLVAAAHPEAQVLWENLIYNDAEHAESVLGVPPGSCRWVPEIPVAPFIQAVTPWPKQPHPDDLNVSPGEWDHNFEVCAHETGCSAHDFACVNIFSLALLSDDPSDNGGPVNVLARQPQQFPAAGAGQVLGVYATPSSGPHTPCPVDENGRQEPCSPLVDGARPLGFVAPDPLHLTVDEIVIDSLLRVGADSFTLKLSYHVLWSDRFAVHPCKISLWGTGGGIPEGGKKVDATKWWLPDPDKDSATKLTFEHSPNLTVYHKPGHLVNTSCYTADDCPWPKQLFFREKVEVQLTESVTWDLVKYPFDKQRLRAKVALIDRRKFAVKEDYRTALVTATLPGDLNVSKLYKEADWSVQYAAVELDASDPTAIVFVLEIKRNAQSVIYKCFIPMIANALVVMLSATLGDDTRLQVLVLSLIVASTMLDPEFLGLPANLEGNALVPFMQSMIIIHFTVTTMLLLYTLCFYVVDRYYASAVSREQSKYREGTKAVWQRHAANYNKWVDALLPATALVEDPESPEPPKSSHFSGAGGAEADGAEGKAAPPAAFNVQRAVLEVLLSIPALFHRQDPTRAPTPGMAEILPKYGEMLDVRGCINGHLIWLTPLAFALAWSIDALIYFA